MSKFVCEKTLVSDGKHLYNKNIVVTGKGCEYMKKRRKEIVVFVGLALLLLCGCRQQKNTSNKQNDNLPEIVIGSDNYPPFNYINSDGEPTGIDVEIATEAFNRMGYKAEFDTIDWENKKALLEEGKIDCLWGCFSMDGRETQYKWAGPYMLSRQSVAVDKNSDIYKLEDLEGKTVAVQTTTKPEELFLNYEENHLPKLKNLFSMQNRELIYPSLTKGYVDAVAAHETSIIQYMKDFDVEYRILDEPLMTVGLGVAFDKEDDRGLDQELSKTMQEMRVDGTMKKIISKYLDNADQYLEVEDYEK